MGTRREFFRSIGGLFAGGAILAALPKAVEAVKTHKYTPKSSGLTLKKSAGLTLNLPAAPKYGDQVGFVGPTATPGPVKMRWNGVVWTWVK